MADLRKLKDKAADLAARGKLEKAADLYREVLQADPRDVGLRQKLAEVLRRSGQVAEAVARYAEVAERFARDGLLIKAIAICKTILELDPRHEATQALLADLYGRRAAADGQRSPARTIMGLPGVVFPPEPTPERGVVLPLPTPAPRAKAPPPPPTPEVTIEIALAPPEEPLPEVEVDLGSTFDAPAAPPDPFAGEAPPPARPATPLLVPLETLPPVPEPPETAFALIMSAAGQALASGVEEGIAFDPDLDEDAGPLAGDEPLAAPAPLEALPEAALEPLEPLEAVEPAGPAPSAAPTPPASPPARTPARAAPAAAPRLPRVPLFSDLGREAFVALTEGLVLHRYTAGEVVLREGEGGASFFVVATGHFVVSRTDETGAAVPLARLGEGEFFGEMALLSGAPRSATVTAEGPAEVLELPAPVLQSIAGRHPHLAASLRRFCRQRLLANAMAVSPILRPFGRAERKQIIERFRTREVEAGEVLVREGERSDGLYVILDGAVDVSTRRAGAEVLAGRLAAGDLFGEMSCLRKSGATATITARRAGTVLRLPRADFDELVMSYPQILELVSTLSDERQEGLDAILTGHAEYTPDGLVLI
ncbi:MAG: cyclic nucleotide-binding domain-containing protein [Anaeromyxobacter sp.]|nr:cyclic nucleotide-binding domain-containing protein [Anaeromyxobacter sp.]MBL0277935.1 cyclic nucleotide-binding domain-containing protein [Anaeromyxobacter sp.]